MKIFPIAAVAFLSVAAASCGEDGEPNTTSDPQAPQAEADGAQPPAAPAIIDDIAAAQPQNVAVALENPYVRVLRFDLDPDEALPPHRGGRRVVYALTDYEIDWSEEGTDGGVRAWKAGEVHVHDAGVHSLRNVGETPASFVVFERSETPLPAEPEVGDNYNALPKGARSLYDGDDVEVVEIDLAPRQRQRQHAGGWRAVYSLSDYEIQWRENRKTAEKTWTAGEAHWHEPARHGAKNIGDTDARWLVVSFKN